MGFDAFLQVHLSFEKGRPYFFNPGLEREFDLTKIPRIPEEFQCFETLRGWSYGALLNPEPNEMEVDVLVKFCEWVRSTDVEFKYMLSY